MRVKTIVYNSNVSLFTFLNRHPSKRLTSEFVQTVLCTSSRFPVMQKPKWTPKVFHFFYRCLTFNTQNTVPVHHIVILTIRMCRRQKSHRPEGAWPSTRITADINTPSSGVRISRIALMTRNTKDTVPPKNGKVIQHWQNTVHLCADSPRHRQRDLPVCCTKFSGLRSILHEISTPTWPPQRNKDFYHSIKITVLCRQTNNNL